MDELGLKLAVAAHVAELRQMAKEAEDFVIRLSHLASTVEHQYRYLRERDTIMGIPVKADPSVPPNVIKLEREKE